MVFHQNYVKETYTRAAEANFNLEGGLDQATVQPACLDGMTIVTSLHCVFAKQKVDGMCAQHDAALFHLSVKMSFLWCSVRSSVR